MLYFCYVLLAIGLICYVIALLNIGGFAGELYSDIGNAVWLLAVILLLVRLSHRLDRTGLKQPGGSDTRSS